MPKTADRRAEVRRAARVQRAHQEAPSRPVSRRVPAARRKAEPRGILGAVRRFPFATTIFVLLLVGLSGLVLYNQHIGPFTQAKTGPLQATCNLQTHICNKAPLMTINVNKTYTATIKTTRGNIVMKLDAKDAPIAVNNFVFLAQQQYYNGTYFWRVERPGLPSPLNPTGPASTLSLIQGGSINPDGLKDVSNTHNPPGPPGYTFKDEKVTGDYTAGTVAMAKSTANSNGAQFFICTGDNSGKIQKTFTIFATVTSGLSVAQSIQPDDKILSISIAVK